MKRREFLRLAGAALLCTSRTSSARALDKLLRVVVIANRYHEADGLMAAVCNQMAHNPSLSTPYSVNWPRVPSDPPLDSHKPRCLIDIFKDKAPSATMEIWCIDDLVNSKGDSDTKARAMNIITNYGSPPDGVVAFGTAGYPGAASNNGCATIGGTIFIHDASNGAAGGWSWPGNMESLIPSKIPASFFSTVSADNNVMQAISREMIAPKNNPANSLKLIIAADAVGISSVNIQLGAAYCDVDTNAITTAQAKGATNITSVETTHGVIRSKWPDAPFIYVTAIPNRVCHFPDEAQNNYAQEFPSSHNAGVALKYAIPYFTKAIAP